MRQIESSQRLMQLLLHHYRSLPIFLTEAVPWTHRGDEQATNVLLDIVAGQRDLSNRIAAELEQRGWPLDMGEYPMDFLDLHFLSLDFLLQRLVENQQREVDAIARLSAEVNEDPVAHDLAQEALGAAKGYLESLTELMPDVVAGS